MRDLPPGHFECRRPSRSFRIRRKAHASFRGGREAAEKSRLETSPSRFARGRSDRFALRICGSAFLVLLLVSSLFALSVVPVWADRPALRFSQGGRASLRSKADVPSEIVSRLEADFSTRQKRWNLFPFVEARWDVDDSTWSKVELGAEVGIKPFSKWGESSSPYWKRCLSWLYLGAGIYQRWFSPEVNLSSDVAHPPGKLRVLLPGNPHTELETRLVVDVPLPWSIRSRPLGLYALTEYVFDFNEGRGIRSEVAAGIKIPLPISHPVSASLGWRHVDLIHLLDVDQFEGSIQVEF